MAEPYACPSRRAFDCAPAEIAGGCMMTPYADNLSSCVALLIAFPLQMTSWALPLPLGSAAAPGFLDGTAPTAAPVPVNVWAAPVTVNGELTGVVTVDAQGGAVTGTYTVDTAVAAAVSATIEGTALVRDASDGAWYLVESTTVHAVGQTATSLLSGPVDLGAYSAILRERRGLTATASAAASEGTDSGVGTAMPLWIPVIGVLVVVAGVVLLTTRHEHRVLRPLREPAAEGTAAEHTAPDDDAPSPAGDGGEETSRPLQGSGADGPRA